ncbi:MAG: hypothetical protein PVJ57_23010 [Phycisphaerae bacterium]|jgi:septal ring factor EnvC (AmiA/AmiB activator)
MADTQPASRDQLQAVEGRVERLETDVRDDRDKLYRKVNATSQELAVLRTEFQHVAGEIAEVRGQGKRIETKLDEYRKEDSARREADQHARSNRLWTWIAIIGGWLFAVASTVISNLNGGSK